MSNTCQNIRHSMSGYCKYTIFFTWGLFPQPTFKSAHARQKSFHLLIDHDACKNKIKGPNFLSPSVKSSGLRRYSNTLLYELKLSRTVIFAVLARCGNSRVVNFAILLMLSLL